MNYKYKVSTYNYQATTLLFNIFEELECMLICVSQDESTKLQCYFVKDHISVTDLLKWWFKQYAQVKYLILLYIAINYFCIPYKSFSFVLLWFTLIARDSYICGCWAYLFLRLTLHLSYSNLSWCLNLLSTDVSWVLKLF